MSALAGMAEGVRGGSSSWDVVSASLVCWIVGGAAGAALASAALVFAWICLRSYRLRAAA